MGILVQLPLPPQLDANAVLLAVDPAKDADGFHPLNAGRLMTGRPGVRPCTPLGFLRMLDAVGVELKGKRALVLGRSNIALANRWPCCFWSEMRNRQHLPFAQP